MKGALSSSSSKCPSRYSCWQIPSEVTFATRPNLASKNSFAPGLHCQRGSSNVNGAIPDPGSGIAPLTFDDPLWQCRPGAKEFFEAKFGRVAKVTSEGICQQEYLLGHFELDDDSAPFIGEVLCLELSVLLGGSQRKRPLNRNRRESLSRDQAPARLAKV